MKKFIAQFIILVLGVTLLAQSPQQMSYQAIVRDAENNLLVNQVVGLELEILEGGKEGTPVYAESHEASTNANGLLSVEIGNGAVTLGQFTTIDWANGSYFIHTAIDPEGGTDYTISGVTPLLSVPYALHASTADRIAGQLEESDPVFAGSVAADISSEDTAYWNSIVAMDNDNSPSNELQVLSISNDTIFLSDGGSVKVPFGPADGEENDLISFDGENWVAASAIVQSTGNSVAVNNMQPFRVLNYCIALYGIYPSRNGLEPFIAEIMIFAGNFAPRNWAKCDGQLLPINSFQSLFSLVGTYYGGDGRTTFGLPDLRGRVPIHQGQGPGLTSRSMGQSGGSETNVLNVNQIPAHNHTIIYQ